jgi:hypothetical protein
VIFTRTVSIVFSPRSWRSRSEVASPAIEQRKREATREQDGPCAAVRPLGEEGKRTTALVTEAGLFHRDHP